MVLKSILRVLVAGAVMVIVTTESHARSALADSTDVKIRNGSSVDARGSENSVFIHPTDSRILVVAQNSHSDTAGVNAWVSQDAGKTWSGSNFVIGGPGQGDPAAVVRRSISTTPVRYLVGQLGHMDGHDDDLELGQVAMYKESATALAWTPNTVVTNEGGFTDKNHMWVDNHASSTYTGNLYAAWTNVDDVRVEAAYSTDGGVEWSEPVAVSAASTTSEWGVNLVVSTFSSTRGNVYAAWGETSSSAPAAQVTSLYFNKSTDGGATWGTPSSIRSLSGDGYAKNLNELGGGKNMGTTSAPNLATDAAGNIYVVWTQERIGASDAEVYIMKSTNEGSTWTAIDSNPKRVSSTSTGDQWHSWVTYDDCTDAIVVLYYDSRNNNAEAESYISVSYDGGSNFTDVKVSDTDWAGDDGGSYDAGEYIGIAARDGIAYPIWSDDRESSGTFKTYSSPIYLWGVTQASVTHTIENGPVYELGVTGEWDTSMAALGTDTIKVTSPTSVVYTEYGAGSGPGLEHAVKVTCVCEVGTWRYVVKSTRTGFMPRGSDERTFTVPACVD